MNYEASPGQTVTPDPAQVTLRVTATGATQCNPLSSGGLEARHGECILVGMQLKLAILGLLAFCLPACGAPDKFGFDVRGTEGVESSVLQVAADEWCEATGRAKCPSLAGGDSSIILTDARLNDEDSRGTTWLNNNGTFTIRVRSSASDRADSEWIPFLHLAALHEMGHALGCYTHLGPGTLMSATYDGLVDYITPADIDCVMARE